MQKLHLLGPALTILAWISFAAASWRMGRPGDTSLWLSGIARTVGIVLIALLVLYSWAWVWVYQVSQYFIDVADPGGAILEN